MKHLWQSIGIVAVLAAPAFAHYKLVSPVPYSEQDNYGDPQKTSPCGPTGNSFTATNAVTEYKTGSTIQIKIDETITHPGHYRVSLAQTMAELPPDPAVTAVGSDQCGMLAINPSPTLPLLADGLLVHTSSFGGAEQTVDVQLPAGMTCTNCVLQVQEFMSHHGAPCFYHHCAMVTITDNPVNPPPSLPDAGPGSGDVDAGAHEHPSSDGGGCSAGLGAGIAMGFAGLGLRRRRRR